MFYVTVFVLYATDVLTFVQLWTCFFLDSKFVLCVMRLYVCASFECIHVFHSIIGLLFIVYSIMQLYVCLV